MATYTVRERIERIINACNPGLWGTSGVTSWEKDRILEWRGREHLSSKQIDVLVAIEKKVFPEEDDG